MRARRLLPLLVAVAWTIPGTPAIAAESLHGSEIRIARAAGPTTSLFLLAAVDPAPGEWPVVLGSKSSGVMVHEAVGHPLEADSNWQKTSIMWDKLGQMVASPLVTIYEDATIPGYRGSLNVDDEGNAAGTTPTMVNGWRLSSTSRPMTAGSPPNRRRQNASPSTSTALPPGFWSSSGRKLGGVRVPK